jgi:hypothetical protein
VAGGKARRALDVAVLGGKFVTRGIAGSARSSFCPLGGRFVTRVALAARRVTKCPPELATTWSRSRGQIRRGNPDGLTLRKASATFLQTIAKELTI